MPHILFFNLLEDEIGPKIILHLFIRKQTWFPVIFGNRERVKTKFYKT